MKKILLLLVSLLCASQISAQLDQELKALSATLVVLEAQLTGQAPVPPPQPPPPPAPGPQPPPSETPEQVRARIIAKLEEFKANTNFNAQNIEEARRYLAALEKPGVAQPELEEYRILIENRLHDLGLVPPPPPPPAPGPIPAPQPPPQPVPGPQPVPQPQPQPAPVQPPAGLVEPGGAPKPVFVHSLKKAVLNPLRQTIPSVHEENSGPLSATIGITQDGSLVVWGPTLKQQGTPSPDIFIHDGKQFIYPNTDQINKTNVGGRWKADYAVYVLINMPELKAQKQAFDQLKSQFEGLKRRRAEIIDLKKAQEYMNSLQSLITDIVAAFNKSPLLVNSIHPNAFTTAFANDVLTAATAEQLMKDVYSLVTMPKVKKKVATQKVLTGLIEDVQSEFDSVRDTKAATVANIVEEEDKERSWKNRVSGDKTGKLALVQAKLDQLPGILASLQAIDLTPLRALENELSLQSNNQALKKLDDYYTKLEKEEPEEPTSSDTSYSSGSEDGDSDEGQLSDDEDAELETLKDEFIANGDNWRVAGLTPGQVGDIKAKLQRYAVLKKKETPSWKPAGKIFALYTYHQVNP